MNALVSSVLWMVAVVLHLANAECSIVNAGELAEFVQALVNCGNNEFPGMTVAIVRKNETQLWTHGVTDTNKNQAVTADTKFGIGSITKSFTAAYLTQQLEDHELNLTTTVKGIWGPSFKLVNENLTSATTVQDLLAHRVGLTQHFGGYYFGRNISRIDLIKHFQFLPVARDFRQSFVYNNYMYALAGALNEKLDSYGRSWECQLTENIFKPLGMRSTEFAYHVANWDANIAMPHYFKDGRLVPTAPEITAKAIALAGPAAAIFSTGKDMAKWLQIFLQPKNQINKLFSANTLTSLFTVQNPNIQINERTQPVNISWNGYGLGWYLGNYRDQVMNSHTGYINNYISLASLLPESQVGIFISINGARYRDVGNKILSTITYWIMDRALKLQPWLDKDNVCSITNVPAETEIQSASPYECRASNNTNQMLLGVYQNQFLGVAIITRHAHGCLFFNYGAYGKAFMFQIGDTNTFKLHFIDDLWYFSESSAARDLNDVIVFNHNKTTHVTQFTAKMFDKRYVVPVFKKVPWTASTRFTDF